MNHSGTHLVGIINQSSSDRSISDIKKLSLFLEKLVTVQDRGFKDYFEFHEDFPHDLTMQQAPGLEHQLEKQFPYNYEQALIRRNFFDFTISELGMLLAATVSEKLKLNNLAETYINDLAVTEKDAPLMAGDKQSSGDRVIDDELYIIIQTFEFANKHRIASDRMKKEKEADFNFTILPPLPAPDPSLPPSIRKFLLRRIGEPVMEGK